MLAVAEPGAVVGSENNERVVAEVVSLEGCEDFADGPIDLLHHVAEQAALGLAGELFTHVQRHVDHRVRDVEEERLVVVTVDEVDGVFRVPGGELALFLRRDFRDLDLPAVEERQAGIARLAIRLAGVRGQVIGMERPHVIRVRQAEILVEAMPRRQELREMPKMPLAEDGGCVSARLEQLGDRRFAVRDAVLGFRPQRAGDADTVRVAAGQERRTRR